MSWKRVLFIAFILYGAYQYYSKPTLGHAGINQQQQKSSEVYFVLNDYLITPLEDFSIEARVLAAEHYSFDREADLSPVDLVLGWGKMSDENILKDIKISQSRRFYYWRVKAFPISRREIETHSANMHMVPANEDIKAILKSARKGQTVTIKGQLINAKSDNGWLWKSSLTREDTGKGACELVYVEEVSIR